MARKRPARIQFTGGRSERHEALRSRAGAVSRYAPRWSPAAAHICLAALQQLKQDRSLASIEAAIASLLRGEAFADFSALLDAAGYPVAAGLARDIMAFHVHAWQVAAEPAQVGRRAANIARCAQRVAAGRDGPSASLVAIQEVPFSGAAQGFEAQLDGDGWRPGDRRDRKSVV